MNHDHPTGIAGSSITDMEAMWILMAVMFVWNFYMAWQHSRLNKKVECSCKEKK